MLIDRRFLIAAGALALLGGCYNAKTQSTSDPLFGESNRQTFAAQVVDPEPVYAEPAASDANHAAQAVDRYNTGKVIKPDRVQTQSGGSGGGGGGGSGGS